MAEHDAFDLTRLERMERRLQALEDAEAIRNLKSRYAALCDDTMMRTGSLRSLLRMRPGKAQVWVGSKAATRFVGFFRVQPGSSHSPSITV
jgi:hypothetical protein